MNLNEIYQLIDQIPNKDVAKYTTSKKFKQDLAKYFLKNKYASVIEFGSCQGNSSIVFSYLFDQVLGLEYDMKNIDISTSRCSARDNVKFLYFDVYSDWKILPSADVLNLDAMHDTNGVLYMIKNAVQYYPDAIIIMDDYGHEDNVIKPIIDAYIDNQSIEVIQWIGEDKGFIASNGKTFIDKEGLIFKFKL